ncbi:SOS response-associated peptidase [Mesorhizobium sp. BHbdii]
MCGRFALTATPDQTAAFLGLAELEDFPARYNIAPTQPVVIAIAGLPQAPGSNQPDRQSMLVRWGLILAWVKDTREFPLLFNARSEGATEKASFRTAMRHRRALVPASGFYEWRQSGGKRAALLGAAEAWRTCRLRRADRDLCRAGRFRNGHRRHPDRQRQYRHRHSHDRMPVVIDPQDFARWLDCRTLEPRDVADLLRPAQLDFFEAVAVSDLVNEVANTGPEIQERGVVGPEPEKARRQNPGADDSQMTLF